MSDADSSLSSLIPGASIITLSSVLRRGMAFGARIVIIGSLTPELFGGIALAFIIGLTVSKLFVFGVPKGIARMCGSEAGTLGKVEYVRAGGMLILATAIPVSLLTFVGSGQIAAVFDDPALYLLLPYFSVFIFLKMLEQSVIGSLRGFELSKETAIVRDLVPEVVSILVLAAFLLSGDPYLGAVCYFLSRPTARLLAGAVVLHRNTRSYSLIGIPRRGRISELARFSWPLAFDGAILLLMGNVDVLLLGFFLESSDVGIYRASQTLSQLLVIVLFAFGFVYLPFATRLFSNDQFDRLEQTFKQTTKWIALVTLPAAVGLFVFSEDILRIIYTNDYAAGAIALQILTLGMFVRVLAGLDSVVIKAIDRTKVDLIATSGGLLTNFALNLYLIPKYGLEGAAIGTVAGFVVYNVIEIGIIYREMGIHPYSADMFKPFLFVLASGALFYSLPGQFSPLFVFLGWGAIFAVTAVSVFLTRSVTEADYKVARQLLP